MVQWYPGHIAKAEKSLKEQLRAVDIVVEVRDGRIPMSTRHPQIPDWVGGKPRVLVLNRRDMVPDSQAKEWSAFFRARGHSVVWTNANQVRDSLRCGPRAGCHALAAQLPHRTRLPPLLSRERAWGACSRRRWE